MAVSEGNQKDKANDEGPPFLYRLTVGRELLRRPVPCNQTNKCRCCSDTGVYTETAPGDAQGRLEFCQFCTGQQVLLHGGRYRVVKGVGHGAFSTVWLAQDLYTPDLAPVALKIFHEQYQDIGLAVSHASFALSLIR